MSTIDCGENVSLFLLGLRNTEETSRVGEGVAFWKVTGVFIPKLMSNPPGLSDVVTFKNFRSLEWPLSGNCLPTAKF